MNEPSALKAVLLVVEGEGDSQLLGKERHSGGRGGLDEGDETSWKIP